MKPLLPFVVVGITTGSVYGLAATGLVLSFRTSGILNFAHGAIGAVSAYAFYDLHVTHGLPWPVALVLAVLGVGVLTGVVLERVTAPLVAVPAVFGLVATVGLLVFMQSGLSWRYGPLTMDFPPFLPTGGLRVAGITVGFDQLAVVATGLIGAVGLCLVVEKTRLGVAMRAVVDDAELVALTGSRPARIRRVAWGIGCGFAALSGILIAPFFGRDPVRLTLFVVQTFGAAAVGAFSSLPWAYAGGVALGVLTALAVKLGSGHPSAGWLPTALPYIVLLAVVVLRGDRRHTVQGGWAGRAGRVARARLAPMTGVGVSVALFLALPLIAASKVSIFANGLTFGLVFVSLGLLVWVSGQISLCHAVFVAVGATTFSHLTLDFGLPWAAALVLAGFSGALFGVAAALPALRLSGTHLAVATLAFGLLVQHLLFGTGLMFGNRGFRSAGRPVLPLLDGHTDTGFYYVVLAVVVSGGVFAVGVTRSRLGRFLRGLRDAPVAMVAHGLDVALTRLQIFAIASFLAAVAGALLVTQFGQVSGDAFGPFQSLLWLAVLMVSGRRLIASPAVAAGLLVVVPAYLPAGLVPYQPMVFGFLAAAVAVLWAKPPVWPSGEDRRARSPVRDRQTATRRPASVPTTALAEQRR